jgi:SDR family mycofactocin-dependent oxidoreductase
MGRLAGKVVLVTGAGRGMGRSHALRLAEEGADLLLVDICAPVENIGYPMSSPQDLAETVSGVEARGRSALAAEIDIRDRATLTSFIDEGVARLGRLDGSVANAGVLTSGTWNTVTDDDWRTVVDTNLIGTWNTCVAAIPHLMERGGSLVNISSAAALKGNPLTTSYTASKYGIMGMTLALANELARYSIRVNTVHPTGVMTGMISPPLGALLADERPDLAPLYDNALPVPLVDAVDVSNAVLYLLCDESRYVTGTQLKVDAGVSIR